MPTLIDLAGRRFGRLLVLCRDKTRVSRSGGAFWVSRCDCGTEKSIQGAALKTGATRSCGCLRDEASVARIVGHNTTHGLASSPEYQVWNAMHQRCTNPNQLSYALYGARGISVCEQWRTFESFYADMGPRPGPAFTIERIDNNGNYEPGNCRWATRTEQARNRRTSRLVTIRGETACVAEWMERLGLSRAAVLARARRARAA